jgi:hypothetical protein
VSFVCISVAFGVNSFAGVLDSTAYEMESGLVSRWIALQFVLLVSWAIPYVKRRILMCFDGPQYIFFSWVLRQHRT